MAKKKTKQDDDPKPLEKPVPDELMSLASQGHDGVLEPKDRFWVNVTARFHKMGFADVNALADHLNFRREDRKWLHRVMKNGLKRPSKATADQLKKLAAALGCDPDDLWKQDFDFNPLNLSTNKTIWVRLIRDVRDWFTNWELVKRQSPEKARELVRQHGGSEVDMVADWIAMQHGAARPGIERAKSNLGDALINVMKETWEWELSQIADEIDVPMGSVNYYVYERAHTHPRWAEFEETYMSPLYEYAIGWKRQRGLPEKIEPDDFWKLWDGFTEHLRNRTPTPEEVYEQFRRHYLDIDSPESRNVAEGMIFIMSELNAHVAWPEYVRRHHDDDIGAAEAHITSLWREATIRLGDKVGPIHLVRLFERQWLDELIPPDS